MIGEFSNPDRAFNNYEHVHIIFYSEDSNGDFFLLLHTERNLQTKLYKEIFTPISNMDTSPAIAASRVMSSSYFGLFTNKNLNKIFNLEKLELEDLDLNSKKIKKKNKYKNIPWYKLRETKSFIEWIKKMENNPIQYDTIEGKQIYLIEIPYINMTFLNNNLSELEYPFSFEYFKYDYYSQENYVSDNFKILEETFKLINSFDVKKYVKSTINEDIFIVLSCVPPRNNEIDNGGCFLLFSLFAGLYRKNNEKWLLYTAYKDEFPDEEILKSPNCKAIIIPGSGSHVYNRDSHTVKAIDFIKNFMNNPELNHVKFMGICFGHQIFSEAMGGMVQKNEVKIEMIEDIKIDEAFWKLDFMSNKNNKEIKKTYKVKEIHHDEVKIKPNYLKNYANSSSCDHELFVSIDNRVLTFQGHPEYTPEFYFFRIYKTLIKIKKPTKEVYEKYLFEYVKEKNINNSQIDFELRNICYSFLKH